MAFPSFHALNKEETFFFHYETKRTSSLRPVLPTRAFPRRGEKLRRKNFKVKHNSLIFRCCQRVTISEERMELGGNKTIKQKKKLKPMLCNSSTKKLVEREGEEGRVIIRWAFFWFVELFRKSKKNSKTRKQSLRHPSVDKSLKNIEKTVGHEWRQHCLYEAKRGLHKQAEQKFVKL